MTSEQERASPAKAAAEAQRELRRLARPAGRFDASRYFRGTSDLGFHNIGTKQVRAIARSIYLANRDSWSVDDAVGFADRLIADRYLEAKGIGIELLSRYRRQFTPALLRTCKGWLSRSHASNWATTDALCGLVIGPLLLRFPTLRGPVAGWSAHRNLWVRRASAVGLIPSIRRGLGLDLAYRVARHLHPDREDLIQKAVGWMLREAGKSDERRLERYLIANGPRIPRTTLRYAIERFPDARRRAILEETKAAPVKKVNHGN